MCMYNTSIITQQPHSRCIEKELGTPFCSVSYQVGLIISVGDGTNSAEGVQGVEASVEANKCIIIIL